MPVYPFANKIVLALLLALLSATAAAESAQKLLKKSAIYCSDENRSTVEEMARAGSDEALIKQITQAILSGTCAANKTQARAITNLEAMPVEGGQYYCYNEYLLDKPDSYKFCTLGGFITTIGDEYTARSGAYTVNIEDKRMLSASCKEGGQLLFQNQNGKWLRFTIGVFPGAQTKGAVGEQPGGAQIPGSKVSKDELVKGCKGIDYLN